MDIFLETKRLIISPPNLDDFDKIFLLDCESDVMRYIGNGLPRSKEEAKKWFEKSVSHSKKHGFSFGLVYEKETGEFIGRAGINYNTYDDTQPDIEIGYRLFKKYWNKGFATELAAALIKWGFQNLNIIRLCGITHPDNKISQKVLENVGMQFVGFDNYANQKVMRYEILNPSLDTLNKNLVGIYDQKAINWLRSLPLALEKLKHHWNLSKIAPVENMTFHYVAKADSKNNESFVIKISCDHTSFLSEMNALKSFNGHGCIQLIDFHDEYNALLLQQAVPGLSLKSLPQDSMNLIIDHYMSAMNKLHSNVLPKLHNFPHVEEWLKAIDQVRSGVPRHLLNRAIDLKNKLIHSMKNEILLHGDLHLDNILKHGDQWLVIDPKGVIGEREFEIFVLDFIKPHELKNNNFKNILHDRVNFIAKKSNLDSGRLIDWAFVRLILSSAWSIEDKGDPSYAVNLAQQLEDKIYGKQ